MPTASEQSDSECCSVPTKDDIMISHGKEEMWPSLSYEISRKTLRYGCSGAQRGMDGAWRKKSGTFSEMLSMNKMLLQEVLARRSPRCSPRLDSKRTSLNSVDTRPNLRALIDDRSRYQRSLCAHAAPA